MFQEQDEELENYIRSIDPLDLMDKFVLETSEWEMSSSAMQLVKILTRSNLEEINSIWRDATSRYRGDHLEKARFY